MRNERLVLNSLVFANEVENGVLQEDLLWQSADLGFTNVEIRREYFKDLTKEIPVIQKVAKRLNLGLFYSVPDEVYMDGTLNPKLNQYLDEAKKMGVKHIKWNIGNFTGELYAAQLRKLLEQGVAISIENDQTQTSGTISAIKTFMEAVKKEGIDIGYVYDLGNWRFVGEDEQQAAEILKEYVRYIHVKDVLEKPVLLAVGLDRGVIDWRKALAVLPKSPIAIEYPTTSREQILEAKQLLEEYIS
ncbi:TIM barrel protein [Paenibacillus sp.]|jgi:sugar phosphate isomerase/epimerase|uniref:sugar phosphate isomerase/epimerase family protein n=1 Tax=Paenibacillus sp. TaxID=58172 RepID=UPI00281F5AC2|nr:TIM barrel protein [Paenibacillus sp.]MDR0267920.1 sugar phosphate isomerase/epimerase [Paenibacillus sp.]